MKKMPLVKDFMATSLVTLNTSMTIFQAIDVLLKNGISGAPVVDAQKQLVGVLSEKDCLRLFANGAFHQNAAGGVADYMSTKLTTVRPDDDLFNVADVFLRHSFRRLPVLDGKTLVGQVSRRDVLAASRKIWETSPLKEEWTDSKYLSEEMKATLTPPQAGRQGQVWRSLITNIPSVPSCSPSFRVFGVFRGYSSPPRAHTP